MPKWTSQQSGLGGSMTGLTNFIRDIRACKKEESAEAAVIHAEVLKIRKKFQEVARGKSMNTYNRRKYLCKLMLAHVMGYPPGFGGMEALELTRADEFSNKGIGYMACMLLMDERDEHLRLITISLKRDLQHSEEPIRCLALSVLSNIASSEMTGVFAPIIADIILQYGWECFWKCKHSGKTSWIRQRAVLCMLRLYRKNADAVMETGMKGWINELMSVKNQGVLTANLSLVLEVVAKTPGVFHDGAAQVVQALQRVNIDNQGLSDYVYFKVSNPWAQVKLLRILQYLPLPEGKERSELELQLETVISNSTKDHTSSNGCNANIGIMVEAVPLAILMHDTHLPGKALRAIHACLKTRKANIIGTGLMLVSRVAEENRELLMDHTEIVEEIARHKREYRGFLNCETMMRKLVRAVLWTTTPATVYSSISFVLDHALQHFVGAGYHHEVVVRMAMALERDAPDVDTYAVMMSRIITACGSGVPADMVRRLLTVVRNHPAVRQRAALYFKEEQQKMSELSGPAERNALLFLEGVTEPVGELSDHVIAGPAPPVSLVDMEPLEEEVRLMGTPSKPPRKEVPLEEKKPVEALVDIFADTTVVPPPVAAEPQIDPAALKFLHHLMIADDGVLFEDSVLQIGIKSQFNAQSASGQLCLYYGNKAVEPMDNVRLEIKSVPEGLDFKAMADIASTIGPHQQSSQMFATSMIVPFVGDVEVALSYNNQTTLLRIPLHPFKFGWAPDPSGFTPDAFFARWNSLIDKGLEQRVEFKASPGAMGLHLCRQLIPHLHFSVLPNVGTDNDVIGVTLMRTARGAQHAVLIRLEANEPAHMYRAWIRSDSAALVSSLGPIVVDQLGVV